MQEPLRKKVDMGGDSGMRWEVRRDVRAFWPVPNWVEDYHLARGYDVLGRCRAA
jgi:hypothetical protein